MMIEKTVYHYLGQSFPAFMEIPERFPDKPFVVIEKLGEIVNHIKDVTFWQYDSLELLHLFVGKVFQVLAVATLEFPLQAVIGVAGNPTK